MSLKKKMRAIPGMQKYRYLWILLSCALFLSPFLIIPSLVGNTDVCGKMCMRRFFLYFPGMESGDVMLQIQVAIYGFAALMIILLTTFFFGRIWCSFLCPMGGLPELVSRVIPERWKIEFRALPQVPIRYGYFATYLVLMPALGISACTLCNFITIPRLFESFSGGLMGLAFIFSSVGFVNLLLLFILGFFANKGRAYCQFLCPIGAIDGVVNRMGSKFRFTHRIRVERDRCSGCNVCARNCMTGAIKMVDRIAVVDQLSCMSCHECVDVCDWNAIKWTNAPKDKQPKRIKRNVEVHPLPMWTSVYHPNKGKKGLKKFKWGRIIAGSLFAVIVGFGVISDVYASPRTSDPDGCLLCHDIEKLDYIDKQGQLRNASINTSHYLGSLHGSIACTDCHQDIQYYPHEPENVSVDCAASCHLNEPSKGEAYSHKEVTEEFQQSIHHTGWSKGFNAENRIKDNDNDSPSCRFCHSNTSYIPNTLMEKFKETFTHTETECGSCHQGEVWLDQFSGHILRRLIGARWQKTDEVAMCNRCHDNEDRITDASRHSYQEQTINSDETQQQYIDQFSHNYGGKKQPADSRFVSASHSYAMTLHARLLTSNVDEGASCLECHAPTGFNHGIQSQYDPRSATHQANIAKTCASANCHEYSEHPNNADFVKTDLHSIDMLNWLQAETPQINKMSTTIWGKSALALLAIFTLALLANLVTSKHRAKTKGLHGALLGGDSFEKHIINAKTKKNERAKAPKPTKSKSVQTEQKSSLDDKQAQRKAILAKAKAKKLAKQQAAEKGNDDENSPKPNTVATAIEEITQQNKQLSEDDKDAKRKAAIAKAKAKKLARIQAKAEQENNNQKEGE